jgi:hypothetical protein
MERLSLKVRPLNEFQYTLIKFMLGWPGMDSPKLHKGMNKWLYHNNRELIPLHEILRVQLCDRFEVYELDMHADEDVLLAVLGGVKVR